jgi:hypothetical protein
MKTAGGSAFYPTEVLGPVVADGLDRAAFHGLLALGLLLGAFGLLVNVGITTVVAAGEIGRSRLATEVTVDALVIDVKLTGDVFRVFVF